MESDVERRERVLRSDAKSRFVFLALAIVIPLSLHLLFARQERRLQELVAHPLPAMARVTERGEYVHYEYFVDGVRYTWNVGKKDAPPTPEFPIVISARNPSLSRIGTSYTQADYERELDGGFRLGLVGGLFVFFGGVALWAHLRLRSLRKKTSLPGKPALSPQAAGRVVAVLIIGAVVAASVSEREFFEKAFGERALGMPIAVVVALTQAILFAPFFWVFPHLMTIVMDPESPHGVSGAGIILRLARTRHRRSRNIVIAGFAWFVVMVAVWIAYTSVRGI